MQDSGSELPGIYLLGTWVNKGKREFSEGVGQGKANVTTSDTVFDLMDIGTTPC
jgi:hypothetical protein